MIFTTSMRKSPKIESGAASRGRRRPALSIGTALLALSLLAHPRPAAAAGSGPRDVIKATIDAVLAVLRDPGLSSAAKREKIEDVVDTKVDFTTVSRLVLARNWKKLNPGQQRDFAMEFKRHLAITYGDNVDNYRNESVTIVGDREEARGDWTVKSKVIQPGGEDFAVDYRLRQTDGQWHIIDIIIEGVSMVSNFRSQFQKVMANSGPTKLLDLLREKNAKAEPLKS